MRAVRYFALISLAAGIGCQATSTVMTVDPSSQVRKPGGLPKQLKKLMGKFNNGVGNIVDTMHFGPSSVGYIAGNDTKPGCATVKVTIWPTAGSSELLPKQESGQEQGVIVGMVRNETNCDDNAMHLLGGHRGVWVALFDASPVAGTDSVGVSTVVDVDNKFMWVVPENAPLPGMYFGLASCRTPHPEQHGDEAKIKVRLHACDYGQSVVGADQVPPGQRRLRIISDDDATLWFGCSQTCCYASGFEI